MKIFAILVASVIFKGLIVYDTLGYTRSSGCHNDIVNFKDHPHNFRGKSECALGHEGWLKHSFFFHVNDVTLLDADTCILLSLLVLVPELGDDNNWVHSSIFCQSIRYDFKCFSIVLEDNSI